MRDNWQDAVYSSRKGGGSIENENNHWTEVILQGIPISLEKHNINKLDKLIEPRRV